MTRSIQVLRSLLFSAGIAGALTFGANTVLASPSSHTCGDPAAHGTCTGWYGCWKLCERMGYNPSESYCHLGCCYCVLE